MGAASHVRHVGARVLHRLPPRQEEVSRGVLERSELGFCRSTTLSDEEEFAMSGAEEMLEARLRTLEARNRWLGRAVAVLIVGAAIQVTMGYASSSAALRV